MIIRSCRDSLTSIAVTMPPASPTAIAITPTTAGFGFAYNRAVIEYDADVGVGLAAAESGIVLIGGSPADGCSRRVILPVIAGKAL